MIKQLFKLSILSFIFIFSSCSDDDSSSGHVSSQIKFTPVFGNSPYSITDTVTYPNGVTMRFDDFKFYISNIKLLGTNGVESYVDSVELINYNNPGSEIINIGLESGSYEKITFGIGLSPDLNMTDPTLVPSDHPLSTVDNMYWSWATLYKFITLSGFYATSSNSALDQTFAWHPGRQQLYKEVEFNLNQKHFYENTVLEINVDISDLLDKTALIDVPNEANWHGSLDDIIIAEKIVDNFAASLSIKN